MLDVCLITEDGYPFRTTGAAAWAADLVDGLSTLRFGVVHVASGDVPREQRRALPENVERFVEVFVADRPPEPSLAARAARLLRGRAGRLERAMARLEPLAAALGDERGDGPRFDDALEAAAGRGPDALGVDEALSSPESFDLAARLYEARAKGRPFADFYAAHRRALGMLLQAIRPELPPAAIYHAVSGGLGALAGALAAARAGAPLVLTEHDVFDAAEDRPERRLARRLAYERAAAIVTPFEGLRRRTIAAGAPEARSSVVPLGIDVDLFSGVKSDSKPLEEKDAMVVALIGRIAPAKDVKTFLRAAKLLIERLDLVELLIVGTTEDDDRYVRECHLQAQMLGVDRLVRFLGPLVAEDLLPHLDCLVLTSAREGQPRAILEAMAAGVPCVATDAGACRELLEGRTAEDRALGPAGLVCPIGDHEAVAAAVQRIARDAELRRRLTRAGMARADRWFRRERAHEAYRSLYERLRAEARRR